MKRYEEGYKVVKQFAEESSRAKTISSWHKKKIPIDLRRQWYNELVVVGIYKYNLRCEEWLAQENVKRKNMEV